MTKGGWKDQPKRRDRLHIMAEILEITKDGSLKTQIMYKANLSFAQLNEYLSLLLEIKLLETIAKDERTTYRITPKGLQYLKSYERIRELLLKEDRNSLNPSIRW